MVLSAIAPNAIPAWSMSIAVPDTPWVSSGSRSARGRIAADSSDPGEFYILASKEAVQVPPDFAAEMVPFDPLVGEFRVHYAGFFDPGFGYAGAGGQGSRAWAAGSALARSAVH
ncbi:dCTP deaminase domain-containing protein [Streptomyces griseus]